VVRTVLDTATYMLGQDRPTVDNRPYRADCSGFIEAAFSKTAVRLIATSASGGSSSEHMYRTLKEAGRLRADRKLRPGDLVFFHNTWDRNRNGLRDDLFSHVGLVDRVASDGTVSFFHFVSGRVTRGTMNLRHPGEARDPETGKTWNSPIRRGGGRVFAGQLFFRGGHPLDP